MLRLNRFLIPLLAVLIFSQEGRAARLFDYEGLYHATALTSAQATTYLLISIQAAVWILASAYLSFFTEDDY